MFSVGTNRERPFESKRAGLKFQFNESQTGFDMIMGILKKYHLQKINNLFQRIVNKSTSMLVFF
jgi:hypothetical protein